MAGKDEVYASDAAWEHWFDKCAVRLCSQEEQRCLRRQIESAFKLELFRHKGVSVADYEHEDLCDLFDLYFYLHGDIDKPKAGKVYYWDRIDPNEPDALKKLVCGTFFSHSCGRIKDIVRETISFVKGWRPTWKNTPEGKELIWERPLEPVLEDNSCVKEPVVYHDAGLALDRRRSTWRRIAITLFDFLSPESEKARNEVAILVYAIVNGVSPSNAKLQKLLGVKQGQCYKKMNIMREQVRRHLVGNDVMPTDSALMLALRDEVVRHMEPSALEILKSEVGEEYQ